MPKKSANKIVKQTDAIAMVEVATKTFPNAVVTLDKADLSLMLDGRGRWCAARTKRNSDKLYAVRGTGPRSARKWEFLHRSILGLSDRQVQADHRNGDGLDNRRTNLRQATNKQNSANHSRRRNGTSLYLGVSWDKERGKWVASISRPEGGRRHLGRFLDEIEAARAYDAAATELYGDFARPNFPETSDGK
jgi:hypothetical protein